MKKLLSLVLVVLLTTVTFAACTPDPEIVEVEVEVEKIVEVERDLTPASTVTGELHHWMHGAVLANVTATVDIKNANKNSVMVTYGSSVLAPDLDYTLTNAGALTIFGDALERLGLEDGENKFKIITEHGTTDFVVTVVDDPTGTTIPTEDAEVVNMAALSQTKPTAVIANAPRILITEMGTEDHEYSYIEIFNNSTEELNLKGKRIVMGRMDQQSLYNEAGGWFLERPFAMTAAIYIYQDYKVPALKSAVIWVVAPNHTLNDTSPSYPWSVSTVATAPEGVPVTPGATHVLHENPANTKYLVKELNGGTGDLSIAKFREYHGMDDETLVFPTRFQVTLMNGGHNYDATTGLGSVMQKANYVTFTYNNTKYKQVVQIQEIDQTTKFPVGDDATAPAGATQFSYEVDVLNKEEDLYEEGALDKTGIALGGGREFINGFMIRKLYYNASDEFLGYATGGGQAIDVYNYAANATTQRYAAAYKSIATPIVSAIINKKVIENDEGTLVAVNWGAKKGLEYTIPATGVADVDPRLMRFICNLDISYADFFDNNKINHDAVSSAILGQYADEDTIVKKYQIVPMSEIAIPTTTVQVPVSSAYPRDYLNNYKINSPGLSFNFNFGL